MRKIWKRRNFDKEPVRAEIFSKASPEANLFQLVETKYCPYQSDPETCRNDGRAPLSRKLARSSLLSMPSYSVSSIVVIFDDSGFIDAVLFLKNFSLKLFTNQILKWNRKFKLTGAFLMRIKEVLPVTAKQPL